MEAATWTTSKSKVRSNVENLLGDKKLTFVSSNLVVFEEIFTPDNRLGPALSNEYEIINA